MPDNKTTHPQSNTQESHIQNYKNTTPKTRGRCGPQHCRRSSKPCIDRASENFSYVRSSGHCDRQKGNLCFYILMLLRIVHFLSAFIMGHLRLEAPARAQLTNLLIHCNSTVLTITYSTCTYIWLKAGQMYLSAIASSLQR
jgi:hypothetical protein